MKQNKLQYMVAAALLMGSVAANAQQHNTDEVTPITQNTETTSKAWEIGIGGSVMNWNRVTISDFKGTSDNYLFDLNVKHIFGGANIYLARELNEWVYIDLQGRVGIMKNEHPTPNNGAKFNLMYMGGAGLQLRLTPLFEYKYIEPYLRVGVNYLHKDFTSEYSGSFSDDPTGKAHWTATDVWNPNGRTQVKNNFIPISLGAGVNAWLNDSFGVGLQGDYHMPIQKGQPHFVELSARLIWRIGGKTKRPTPRIEYREVVRTVEKIVEKAVPGEKVIVEKHIYELLDNIHFDFDKDAITDASQITLDKVAELLKHSPNQHFLIIGYTDARGSKDYNLKLSSRRAQQVYDALIARGVNADMLKWKGVGKGASIAPTRTENTVREGDRKVVIEKVTNMEYWNTL